MIRLKNAPAPGRTPASARPPPPRSPPEGPGPRRPAPRREEPAHHEGLAPAGPADAVRPAAEPRHLDGRASEQLDKQRAADVQGLVHHGVHLGVERPLLAPDGAQPPAP